jgi:hypothetical protein
MSEPVGSRTFRDEKGRLWEARYVPDWAGYTLPDAKIVEFVQIDPPSTNLPTRLPVRPGFLATATEAQLRAALGASI